MATFEQIEQLRQFIAEPDNAEPWTDSDLEAMIEAHEGNIRLAASQIWTSKAASAAHLVNISEGGSSRQMSDVHKNALAMAQAFARTTVEIDPGTGGVVRAPARTRAIERP